MPTGNLRNLKGRGPRPDDLAASSAPEAPTLFCESWICEP